MWEPNTVEKPCKGSDAELGEKRGVVDVRQGEHAFELFFQVKWKLQIVCVVCSVPVRLEQLARLSLQFSISA